MADQDRRFRQRFIVRSRQTQVARHHQPRIHAHRLARRTDHHRHADVHGSRSPRRPVTQHGLRCLRARRYALPVGCRRLSQALAPGWESEIEDSLLREDIAAAACGDPYGDWQAHRIYMTASIHWQSAASGNLKWRRRTGAPWLPKELAERMRGVRGSGGCGDTAAGIGDRVSCSIEGRSWHGTGPPASHYCRYDQRISDQRSAGPRQSLLQRQIR